MFNFQNINDYEFETIAKDILEVLFGYEFNTFAKGRDGGIDVATFLNDKIIGQAKHYLDSNIPSLINTLKKERKNLQNLGVEDYYIFTSRKLSQKRIKELYEHFKEYMVSPNNIFDGNKIDALLQNDEYSEVVRKHYKLWIVSTGILEQINNKDVFIDVEVLMDEIEHDIEKFVYTDAYASSRKKLDDKNILILVGEPGIGKTTLSKQLLLEYAHYNYSILFSSSNSISSIKKSISSNPNKKELIFIDDFLGQHYLHLSEDKPNEIKSLIGYIKKNENKILLMNSRIAILNEAERRNIDFLHYMRNFKNSIYTVDVHDITPLQRATILYNHIYFSDIPAKYFMAIRKDRRYYNIINHRNYNPRIIEYVTEEENYSRIKSNIYYQFIMEQLENPYNVWNDEIENRLDAVDRELLYALYSLTDSFIPIDNLQNAYNRLIINGNYDFSKDNFKSSLIRLTKSVLKRVEINDIEHIGVINPSINDYLYSKIKVNSIIVKHIVDNAYYLKQVRKMAELSNKITVPLTRKLISSGDFLNLESEPYSIHYEMIRVINDYKIPVDSILSMIIRVMKSSELFKTSKYIDNKSRKSNELIKFLISNDNLINCKLVSTLNNMELIDRITEVSTYDDIVSLHEYLYECYDWEKISEEQYESILDNIGTAMNFYGKEMIIDELEDFFSQSVSDSIQSYVEMNYYDYHPNSNFGDRAFEHVSENLDQDIVSDLDYYMNKLNSNDCNYEFDITTDEVLERFDFDDEVNSVASNMYDDDYDDDYRESSSKPSDYTPHVDAIVNMFDRPYKK